MNMKQVRCGWIVFAVVVSTAALLVGCGSTGTGTGSSSAGSASKSAVKIDSQPMTADEVAATAAAGGGGAAAGAAPAAAAPTAAGTARAVLQSGAVNPGFSGTVTFTAEGGQVHVVADVAGVPPGEHGFHIHENGVCERDPAGKHFTTAGGHFNPGGSPHGCPNSSAHHAGDLGNIVVRADGTGHLDATTSTLSLTGPNGVVGKAVILHAGVDDCTSQPVGNAGGRLACGVVAAAGH
jgi:Cu-Zn family superoxide dismutase